MRVLSHRGYWKTPGEKNAEAAFARSFSLGFGTETDVRDLNGALVISHDPPTAGALVLEQFLELYKRHDNAAAALPLALNIKADGLQSQLEQALRAFAVTNYFVFDMSVPDTIGYLQRGFPVFTRHSEHEPTPAFYQQAVGVWLDCFASEWFDEAVVAQHLSAGKSLCLVSPDLHKRPHLPFWETLKGWQGVAASGDVLLCTDYPEDARSFFADATH